MYYNVTLRRVHVTTVAVKKAISLTYLYVRVRARACARARRRVHARAWVHACSLAYPACNSYASNCDFICGLSDCTIFFDIISYTARFSKNVIEHKTCFKFLYNFCLKYFSF